MNFFLSFTERKFTPKYRQYQKNKSSKMAIILDFFLIFQLSYLIFFFSFTMIKNETFLPYFLEEILLIIGIFYLILLSVLTIAQYYKKWTIDLIYFMIYTYFLAIFILTLSFISDLSLIFIEGYRLWILNITILISYRIFWLKILHFSLNLSTLIISLVEWKFEYKIMVLFNAISLTIFSLFLIYYQEQNERSSFIKRTLAEKEKRSFLKFLNILPEGIGLFQLNMNEIFLNESIKIMLQEEDSSIAKVKLFRDIKRKLFSHIGDQHKLFNGLFPSSFSDSFTKEKIAQPEFQKEGFF